ncbi:T9SS type A sorting domain-containing protein [Hymenobacter negativus]|uniref:T9SS type A sorting domain-containing protein n=1 Tax=Hymenobacter negativus TaxID=2795026 RepID=A0ABS3QL48_9BACT|nr:T9SS type A sorting domain-containing protein [Hymenobacter negativus]MBO2011887.1 T9SS type A sorting domain-containing protein [Hymenobacter negativus]
MKHVTRSIFGGRLLMLSLLATFPLSTLRAQTAASYTAAATGSSLAAYNLLQPTTTAAVRTAGTADEGYYNTLPIGFTFRFVGANYTTVSASTNGWLTLGQSITAATPTNSLATGTPRPIIAPLWDDISFGTAATPADPALDGDFFYQTTGVAGSRIFTAEWRNVRWTPAAAGPVTSVMVRLFEGTNVVQFQYAAGTSGASGSTRSASVGLAGAAGDYLAASDLSATATFSSTTEASIGSRATSGRIFTFTPPGTPSATRGSVAKEGLQLAPNPAQGQVQVLGAEPGAVVSVFDLQGRLARRYSAASTLDLRGLAPGMYVLAAQVAGLPARTARLAIE